MEYKITDSIPKLTMYIYIFYKTKVNKNAGHLKILGLVIFSLRLRKKSALSH